MEPVDSIIKEIISSETYTGKPIHQLISGLNDGKFKLEDMMKSMEPLIISSQQEERSKSYKVIESLIKASSFSSSSSISPVHLEILVAFIISRLATESCPMQPLLLKILYSIGKHPSLTSSSAISIFKSLHANVVFQSQPVSDRYELFKLLGQLLSKHIDAINETLKYDFVLGFIQMIDGERDPRCLLLTFHLFKLVLSNENVNLGSLTEEAAEVISCYFPIVYHDVPSKGPRKNSITRSDLAASLNQALASNAALAQYILPVISEKLHSEREAAKIDAYEAISSVSTVYGASAMKPYMGLVWSCARSDLLKVSCRDDGVSKAAVKALSSLIEALECDQETLELFLEDILVDLSPAITKADLHLRKSATQLMLAVASTSNSFAIIVPKVIMKAIESLAFVQTVQNETEILSLIETLINCGHGQLTTIDKQIPCQTLIVSLAIDIDDSKGVEMKKQKLQLLLSLVSSPLVFSDEDYDSINKLVANRMVSDSNDVSIVSLYAKIIRSLCNREFLTIGQSLLQLMKDDKFPPETAAVLLEEACFPSSMQHQLISLLLSKLNGTNSLHLISKGLTNVSKCNHSLVLDTLWSLIGLFVHAKLCKNNDATFDEINFAPTVTAITSLLTCDDDALLLSRLAEVAITPDLLMDLIPGELITCHCNNSKSYDARAACCVIISLVTYVMRGVDGDAIDDKVWLDLLDAWFFATQQPPDVDSSLLYDLIFILANKGNENIISGLVTRCPSKFEKQSQEYLVKLCHALSLRCHPQSTQLIKLLNDTIVNGDSPVPGDVVDAYRVLHDEPDETLYKKMNINPLFHQRIYIISSIQYDTLNDERQMMVKKCILNQLPHLPINVIKSDMNRIGPLLITAVTSKINTESREIAINCLLPLLENETCRQSILINVSSIIDSLIDLSRNSPKSSVRCACLNCLTKLATTFSESSLLPLRKTVLTSIKPSLEDSKRIVRYSAYVAHFTWTLLGQPGNSAVVPTDMN